MNGKTIAIVSYITIIGWVIALILNNNEKNSFASFHIRQALGLNLVGMVLSAILPYGFVLGIIMLAFGFFTAYSGRTVPFPVVGDYFQDWFKSL